VKRWKPKPKPDSNLLTVSKQTATATTTAPAAAAATPFRTLDVWSCETAVNALWPSEGRRDADMGVMSAPAGAEGQLLCHHSPRPFRTAPSRLLESDKHVLRAWREVVRVCSRAGACHSKQGWCAHAVKCGVLKDHQCGSGNSADAGNPPLLSTVTVFFSLAPLVIPWSSAPRPAMRIPMQHRG
jgi:hypothetical protein